MAATTREFFLKYRKTCKICEDDGRVFTRSLRLGPHIRKSHFPESVTFDESWKKYWLLVAGPKPTCASPGCEKEVCWHDSFVYAGYAKYCSQPCQASARCTEVNLSDRNPVYDPSSVSKSSQKMRDNAAQVKDRAFLGDLTEYVKNCWRLHHTDGAREAYLLVSEDSFKVGCGFDSENRLEVLNRSHQGKYSLLIKVEVEDPRSVEKELLLYLGPERLLHKKLESSMPYGWTEIFDISHLDLALSKFKELTSGVSQ